MVNGCEGGKLTICVVCGKIVDNACTPLQQRRKGAHKLCCTVGAYQVFKDDELETL